MQYGITEVRCPRLPHGNYLSWASWWHSLSRRVEAEGAGREELGLHVEVDASFWDLLMNEVSNDAGRAILHGEPTIAPVVRAPTGAVVDAPRILRARLRWLKSLNDLSLRPDEQRLGLSRRLIELTERATLANASSFIGKEYTYDEPV
jgi:hypothetical protein